MEDIYKNCLGCHKNLSINHFDLKINSTNYYSRCRKCREIHNNRYTKKVIPYEKSFASHEKAQYWHPTKNDKIKPRDVSKATHKKYWFKCPDENCGHDFDMKIDNITCNNKWCGYCANQKLCNDEHCIICKEKSFASHEKAPFWHPTKNDKIKPRDIFKASGKKYWFKCPEENCGHDFDMSLGNITCGNTWCPHCNLKTEKKFFEHLINNKDILGIKTIKKGFRPKWANLRETHTFYIYDFYIILKNNVKIIIEIDGPQHYIQVSNWSSVLYNQIRDKIKERLAIKNETNMIRLNQEDILKNKNDWDKLFKDFISKKLENNDKIVIYDCADGKRYN